MGVATPQPSQAQRWAAALAACQYHAWQAPFGGVAFGCRTIPLPPAFVDYLAADGVFLPEGSSALPNRRTGRLTDSSDDEDGSTAAGAATAQQQGGHAAGSANGTHGAACSPPNDTNGISHSSDDDGGDGGGGSQAGQQSCDCDWVAAFPEVAAAIGDAITELGGNVVPRLNWSCPTDARWVNPTASLSCSNAEEVVLMLKSSDRVAHDLTVLSELSALLLAQADQRQQQQEGQGQSQGFAEAATAASPGAAPAAGATGGAAVPAGAPGSVPSAPKPVLVLRRWHCLRPEREFRCFVRRGALVAACQRDVSQHYDALRGAEADVRRALWAFHLQHVRPRLQLQQQQGLQQLGQQQEGQAAVFPLDTFVYDVYWATSGAVRMMDVSPVADTTSPLLFDWLELGMEALAAAMGRGGGDGSSEGDGAGGEEDGMEGGLLPQPSGSDDLPLRLVGPGGGMQLGGVAAFAMPFDMLMLQEAGTVDGAVRRMMEAMQGQGQGQGAPAAGGGAGPPR